MSEKVLSLRDGVQLVKISHHVKSYLPVLNTIRNIDMKGTTLRDGFYPQPLVDLHCMTIVGSVTDKLKKGEVCVGGAPAASRLP